MDHLVIQLRYLALVRTSPFRTSLSARSEEKNRCFGYGLPCRIRLGKPVTCKALSAEIPYITRVVRGSIEYPKKIKRLWVALPFLALGTTWNSSARYPVLAWGNTHQHHQFPGSRFSPDSNILYPTIIHDLRCFYVKLLSQSIS